MASSAASSAVNNEAGTATLFVFPEMSAPPRSGAWDSVGLRACGRGRQLPFHNAATDEFHRPDEGTGFLL